MRTFALLWPKIEDAMHWYICKHTISSHATVMLTCYVCTKILQCCSVEGCSRYCQHAHSLPHDELKEAAIAASNLEGSKWYLHAHRSN